MRALVQRTREASVAIGGETVGEIGLGLVVLVCAMKGDDEAACDRLARRVTNLRIFRDEAGRMNRSLLDVRGEALVVSQFTLAAETKGARPGFAAAAEPAAAFRLYQRFIDQLRGHGAHVASGRFGAEMAVALVNDGPVTIWLE